MTNKNKLLNGKTLLKRKVLATALATTMMLGTVLSSSFSATYAYQNDKISTLATTKATVGDEFTSKIRVHATDGSSKEIDCKFKVLTVANGSDKGTVQIGTGTSNPAIDKDTEGELELPNEINLGGETFTVSKLGSYAFVGCTKITGSGLAKNSSITEICSYAYYGAGLTNTGLESNKFVKVLDDSAFYECNLLKDTGLGKNTTVTTLGNAVFCHCEALQESGLGKNTTIRSIGKTAFRLDKKLRDIVFEMDTLPDIGEEAFIGSGVNIFHLPDAKNTKDLATVAADSVTPFEALHVTIASAPTKTNYIGDGDIDFDPTGLELEVTYEKGIIKTRKYSDTQFQPNFKFDKTKLSVGDTKVSIDYLGRTVDLPITVVDKKVTGIEIKQAPTKVNYFENESFNPEGLIINQVYNDGTKVEVKYDDTTKKNFTFDKKDLAKGDNEVSITYDGQTVKQAIKVVEKKVTGIEIKQAPTKVDYNEKERFNPEGLIINQVYNDGTKVEVKYDDTTKKDFTFDKEDLSKGDSEITITYVGQSVKQAIKVKEIEQPIINDGGDKTNDGGDKKNQNQPIINTDPNKKDTGSHSTNTSSKVTEKKVTNASKAKTVNQNGVQAEGQTVVNDETNKKNEENNANESTSKTNEKIVTNDAGKESGIVKTEPSNNAIIYFGVAAAVAVIAGSVFLFYYLKRNEEDKL